MLQAFFSEISNLHVSLDLIPITLAKQLVIERLPRMRPRTVGTAIFIHGTQLALGLDAASSNVMRNLCKKSVEIPI